MRFEICLSGDVDSVFIAKVVPAWVARIVLVRTALMFNCFIILMS